MKYSILRNRFNLSLDHPGIHPKGGSGGSTVQSTTLNPTQSKALESVITKSEQRFDAGPLSFFPGNTLAPESAATTQGRQSILDSIPGLQTGANAGLASILSALQGTPENDPRVAALADSVSQPILDRFRETTLPSISSAAVDQGAFGGDRAGIVKAIAGRETNRAVGEARAGVFNNAFLAGLQQQTSAISQLPNILQSLLAPGQAESAVGASLDGRAQAEIDSERERFEFNQVAPDAQLDNFAARVSGINLGGQSFAQNKTKGGGLFGK